MIDDDLRRALADHRDASADAAEAIDVSASVRRAITAEPRSARWWIPAIAALAAATAIAWFVLRSPTPTAVAENLRHGEDTRLLSSESVELPARLVASDRSGGVVRTSGAEVALWPGTEVVVNRLREIEVLRGGVAVNASRDVLIMTSVGTLTGRGSFEIETARQGYPMTLTRNHKVAGAVAVAVAVTAGWLVFRDHSGAETRIDEPAAAAIDSNGKVTALGSRSRPGSAVANGGASDAKGGNENAIAAAPGAFWDEGEQRIVFALAGEVVDAATGEAIESFGLTAEPIESDGFGSGAVRRSFTGRAGGAFVLNNLGLGTWRVEVRADGYAPSMQTAELGDLYANPMLLFPMTEGAQVTGQVLDWKGRGVKGARVGQPECLSLLLRKAKVPGCAVATSDDEGNFVLPAAPEERAFELRAEHKKYGFAELKNLVQNEGSTRHVVLELSGIIRIYGSVTRGASAGAVADAVVGVDSGERTQTSATGSYQILAPLEASPEAFVESDPNRPKSRARITSYPDNRSARELRWVNAETHVAEVNIDFQLQMESASIIGTVVDEKGKPIPDLELKFHNSAGWKGKRGHETFPTLAQTDVKGRYRVDDVPFKAGYTVTTADPEGGEPTVLGFVSVADESTVVANFAVGSGSIRGEFVDSSGERFAAPSQGCMRLGARSKDSVYQVPKCYSDGRFEFFRLPPGNYTLENRLPQHATPMKIKATKVVVESGKVLGDVNVEVEGNPAQEWRVRVLTGEGRFVPGAYLRYSQGSTNFTSNLEVKADGVALISLSKSQDLVYIDAAGYQSVSVTLKARNPDEVIKVRLEKKAGE